MKNCNSLHLRENFRKPYQIYLSLGFLEVLIKKKKQFCRTHFKKSFKRLASLEVKCMQKDESFVLNWESCARYKIKSSRPTLPNVLKNHYNVHSPTSKKISLPSCSINRKMIEYKYGHKCTKLFMLTSKKIIWNILHNYFILLIRPCWAKMSCTEKVSTYWS